MFCYRHNPNSHVVQSFPMASVMRHDTHIQICINGNEFSNRHVTELIIQLRRMAKVDIVCKIQSNKSKFGIVIGTEQEMIISGNIPTVVIGKKQENVHAPEKCVLQNANDCRDLAGLLHIEDGRLLMTHPFLSGRSMGEFFMLQSAFLV